MTKKEVSDMYRKILLGLVLIGVSIGSTGCGMIHSTEGELTKLNNKIDQMNINLDRIATELEKE